MKNRHSKILLVALTLIFVAGTIITPLVTEAQGREDSSFAMPLEAQGIITGNPAIQALAAREKADAAKAAAGAAGKCSWGIVGSANWGPCFKIAASWIGALLMWAFTKILWASNELFNQAINISVRVFSDYANMDAVKISWGVIRDLINMGFIFVLLYIAIGTILELQGIDWRKLVPKLIIVALLVNFSAFFTRVIIDISNVTANQFYLASSSSSAQELAEGKTPDVTTALMKGVAIFRTTLAPDEAKKEFSGPSIPGSTAGTLDWSQILTSFFGGIVLALVASFVFLTGAILFLIRTIRLLFLIILSPFAFFAMILPNTNKYWGSWVKTLMNDATFAPAFLIMVYVVTQITQMLGTVKGTGSGWVGETVSYMLIIGLLLGAIIVAKALGAAGAAGAMKLAGGVMAGGLGFAGRHTVGRGAKKFAESETAAKWAAKGGVTGWMSRLGMRGSEKVGKASFDVRASKMAKATAKAAGVGEALSGKAQKGGFEAMQEIKRKEAERIGKKIEAKLGPEAAQDYAARMYQGPGIAGGAKSGAKASATVGAAIGTVILPGVGTAVGAGAGALIGAGAGALYSLTRGRRARLEAKAEKYRQEAVTHRQNNDVSRAIKAEERAEKAQRKASKISLMGVEEAGADRGKFDEKALQSEIDRLKLEKEKIARNIGLAATEQGQKVAATLEENLKRTINKLKTTQEGRKKRKEKEKEDSLLKKLREEIDKDKPPTEKPPEETKEE